MDNKSKTRWITRTAVFTALLIVSQAATSPLGNALITGSIVNLLLIVSVMTCGFPSGLTVGIISPVAAKLFGIGPFWSLIPFIIVGNAAIIWLWHIIGNNKTPLKRAAYPVALVCAAVAKSLVLYVGIVKIAVPLLLGLPEQQAAVISNMFSVSQFITALIGGALAMAVLPIIKRAVAAE